MRDFSRRIGLYEFLTYGPLIRLVAKTLMRRIIFANLIGLVILLTGIFYLGQYHAWLIEAKRDSLRAQGEVIAAAIAASATREKDTGRIVINPDMLPEIEGARGLLRDENIAAMQLSIPPERVAPLFKGGLLPADIRARVYATDGVLIVDSDELLSRGQLSTSGGPRAEPAAGQQAHQDQLDPLHALADAPAGAGLSRDRHGQRHGLSGGARCSHRRAQHGDGAGHREGRADRLGGDPHSLSRRRAGRSPAVHAPGRDRRHPAGGAQCSC